MFLILVFIQQHLCNLFAQEDDNGGESPSDDESHECETAGSATENDLANGHVTAVAARRIISKCPAQEESGRRNAPSHGISSKEYEDRCWKCGVDGLQFGRALEQQMGLPKHGCTLPANSIRSMSTEHVYYVALHIIG